MSERPTMQTVAEAAGVSRMTVSLALRGSRRINAQTRRAVQKVADQMGYKPNPMVSHLMSMLRTIRSNNPSGVKCPHCGKDIHST